MNGVMYGFLHNGLYEYHKNINWMEGVGGVLPELSFWASGSVRRGGEMAELCLNP